MNRAGQKTALGWVVSLLVVLMAGVVFWLLNDTGKQTGTEGTVREQIDRQEAAQASPPDDTPDADASTQPSDSNATPNNADSNPTPSSGQQGDAQTSFLGSWTLQDEFLSAGNRRETAVTHYDFQPDQSGLFRLDWLGGKTITAHFTWQSEGRFVVLTFETPSSEQFSDWAGRRARLAWSLSPDGQQLTLSGEDIRSAAIAALQSSPSHAAESGTEGASAQTSPPLFTGSVDPAVYRKR